MVCLILVPVPSLLFVLGPRSFLHPPAPPRIPALAPGPSYTLPRHRAFPPWAPVLRIPSRASAHVRHRPGPPRASSRAFALISLWSQTPRVLPRTTAPPLNPPCTPCASLFCVMVHLFSPALPRYLVLLPATSGFVVNCPVPPFHCIPPCPALLLRTQSAFWCLFYAFTMFSMFPIPITKYLSYYAYYVYPRLPHNLTSLYVHLGILSSVV